MENKRSITRRNFVKTTAMAAGIVGAGGSRISAFGADENDLSFDGLISPREILVQSVSNMEFDATDSKKNIKHIIERLENTSSYKPDLICLSEAFANDSKNSQPVPGQITDAFSSYAVKHDCYIICSLLRTENNKMYNSSVLINRKGEIVGIYNKIHPTEGECDDGVCPGKLNPPVFKTDFGTIGMQICFDINWQNQWEQLKEAGAEIVFWPSTYPNPTLLSCYASLYSYYVVGCSRIDPCYIFDGTGDLISKSGRYEGWAFAKINLEKIFCEIDYHVDKVKKIEKKYGRMVKVKYYHDNDWVTIESRSPNLTIKQLINEYGLTSRWDYKKRAEKYAAKFRI